MYTLCANTRLFSMHNAFQEFMALIKEGRKKEVRLEFHNLKGKVSSLGSSLIFPSNNCLIQLIIESSKRRLLSFPFQNVPQLSKLCQFRSATAVVLKDQQTGKEDKSG